MDENKKFYAGVLVFLMVVFALSYYVIQSGQQDTYTVLYFSNATDPLVYNASENTLVVNFTIENHEGQDLMYAYVIELNDSEVVKKDIILRNNEIAVISESISIEERYDGLNVSVQLYKEGFNGTYRHIWYQTMSSP